jgi:hypothetical protein
MPDIAARTQPQTALATRPVLASTVKQTARLHRRTDFHLQPIQADDD